MATTNAIANKTGTLTVDNALTVTTGDATISAGNVKLPKTSSTAGQIQINATRFAHAFGESNTFLGQSAGNTTLDSMIAKENCGIGRAALDALTWGAGNCAVGYNSLGSVATTNGNSAFGNWSLSQTTGSYNAAFGAESLQNLKTGSYNTVIGVNHTGMSYTGAESSNILIQNAGVTGESNKMRLGTDGTGTSQVDTAIIAGTNVTISGAAAAGTVNIATGDGAKVVTLGSTNGASSLALKYGTADFTIASATGTTMSILDTGEMTMPLQPAFLAYLAANVDNATGAGTAYSPMIIGTEVFDQNGDYAIATGTFTAPVTGRYSFSANVRVSGVTSAMTTNLFSINTSNRVYQVNMSNIAAIRTVASFADVACVNGTVFADMDAADTAFLSITIYGGAGNTADIHGDANANTFFSGHLVC